MKNQNEPPGNDFMIRCPRLGHQIYFSYCRSENQGLPCFKTLDCWHTYFPVAEHLRAELTPEEWETCFGPKKKPKTVSLLELIEQAKKRAKDKS